MNVATNVRGAVAYLSERGYPCSAGTVRALANSGRLRCYRPGVTGRGPMSFTEAHLDAFLRAAEVRVGPGPAPASRPAVPRAPRAVPATRADDWRADLAKVKGA